MLTLLVLAVVLFLIGFITAAKLLFWIAIALLVIGLLGGGVGPYGWGWGYRRYR